MTDPEQKIDDDEGISSNDDSDEGEDETSESISPISRLLQEVHIRSTFTNGRDRDRSVPPSVPPSSPQSENEGASAAFRCPICYSSAGRPCSLACGHLFCLPCAEASLAASSACPLCRMRPNSIVVREVFIENAHIESDAGTSDGGGQDDERSASSEGTMGSLRGHGVKVFAGILRIVTSSGDRAARMRLMRSLFSVFTVYSHDGDHSYVQFLTVPGSEESINTQLQKVIGEKLPRFSSSSLFSTDTSSLSTEYLQFGLMMREVIDTYGAFISRWRVLGVLDHMLEVCGFEEHERRVARFIDTDSRLQNIPLSTTVT